jgi:acetyl-CoA acetyltransferase
LRRTVNSIYEEFAMTLQRSVVFAEPVRTAIGTFGGSLKDIPAPALGAAAIGAAVARAGIRPDEVETVVMGNVVQAGTKMNPARQAAVHAGLPVTTPALTVNRVCGSGAQAIVSAAQGIALGSIDVAVAGGMENMSAGNAPGLNDAASAMVLADATWAENRGLPAAARLVSYGIAAVEPGMFGLGPIPAVKQALQRTGWDIRSIERIEINEAFAAIAIVVARELGLPDDIVNAEGGAVAHGHPIGATGAVLTTKLIHSMRRDGLKRGVVTLCIGGGQGIALAIETLH